MRNKKHRLQGQSRKGRREQTGTDRDRRKNQRQKQRRMGVGRWGRERRRTEKMRGTPGTPGTRGTGGGSRKDRKCIQEMHNTKKRPRNRFRSLLSSAFRPSGAASGILPYSAGCSAGVSAGACAGISAWGIVAGASVSRTRS